MWRGSEDGVAAFGDSGVDVAGVVGSTGSELVSNYFKTDFSSGSLEELAEAC